MKIYSILLVLLMFFVSACTQYYKVTDTASGRQYITSNHHMRFGGYAGTVALRDLKTNKTVVLQSYEMEAMEAFDAKLEIGSY